MKKIIGIFFVLSIIVTTAFADIKPPIRPAPTSTIAPLASATNEAQMAISVSRWSEEPTLVLTKKMIEKINAAAKANGQTALITGETAPRSFSAQTIVGGIFLSLAFVFGGVWLARSKGPVPKPALGILLLAIVGIGATLVIGNVPPPKRIALSSAIINEKVLGNFIASGKVKIMIVDYETKDDISLVLPKRAEGIGGDE